MPTSNSTARSRSASREISNNPDLDREKFDIAVSMFHQLLGDNTDPRADISARTSQYIYQLSYSNQLNAMGRTISAAGEFRWVTVTTADIGNCRLAGNIITLCYGHLIRVADIESFDSARILELADHLRTEPTGEEER